MTDLALPLGWIGVVALALDGAALASIWLSRAHSAKAKTVWTVITVLIPLLGAAAWFVLGRERRRVR